MEEGEGLVSRLLISGWREKLECSVMFIAQTRRRPAKDVSAALKNYDNRQKKQRAIYIISK